MINGRAFCVDMHTSVAWPMVGSRTETEDRAQEAMSRVAPALATGDVRNAGAFTTTVTTPPRSTTYTWRECGGGRTSVRGCPSRSPMPRGAGSG